MNPSSVKRPSCGWTHGSVGRLVLATAAIVTLAACDASSPPPPAPVDPVVGEFQVNGYWRDDQINPSVALAPSGAFVIVWESHGQDGGGAGIMARCFSPTGAPATAEFQVNQYTSADQRRPRVALAADGRFVIVWDSQNQDGAYGGIVARRYQADCAPAGDEFVVNTRTVGDQRYPDLAMNPTGTFVVTWQSFLELNAPPESDAEHIYVRAFHADGTPLTSEQQVDVSPVGYPVYPSVDIADDGRFVVAWQTFFGADDDSKSGVYARRFRADGRAAGDEFIVNVEQENRQSDATIAVEADGSFVVAWQSKKQDAGAGGFGGIYARRFAASGAPLTGEVPVNQYAFLYQRLPSMDALPDGGVVISWESYGQDGSDFGIYARRFDAALNPLEDEFQVNTYTTDAQRYPAVAANPEGTSFIVVWQSGPPENTAGGSTQDGSRFGVFAQRFDQEPGDA